VPALRAHRLCKQGEHGAKERAMFWLLIIVIYEAIQLPWRWRSLRARL
jgi:hypothetical protein